MSLTFHRPMLAASLLHPKAEHTDDAIKAAMGKMKYPVMATLKMDGIRALRLNGTLLSRKLKQIPNESIRRRAVILPGGMDMELWNPELEYHKIESIVMSREHELSDTIQFHILDWFGVAPSYVERVDKILKWWESDEMYKHSCFELPMWRQDAHQLWESFSIAEKREEEGICFRLPTGPYKQGRSTLKEQYLVKLSRYTFAEGFIVGFVEQQCNTNSSRTNALGLAERSSHAMGKRGKDTLGAVVVRWETSDVAIGTGFTDKLRQEIWDNRGEYLGRMVKFKFKGCGTKDLPRHPTFVGWRSEIDL